MVKVGLEEKVDRGQRVVSLVFEASKADDMYILDAVRAAMFGDFEKRGTYLTGTKLLVEVKAGVAEVEAEDGA